MKWWTWLIIAFVVGIIVILIVDMTGKESYFTDGIIIEKLYTPPRTEMYTTYNSTTKTYMPHTRHIPASYEFILSFGEYNKSWLTDKITYATFDKDEIVKVKYKHGRIFKNSIYIINITKNNSEWD